MTRLHHCKIKGRRNLPPPALTQIELGSTGRPKAAVPCTSWRTRMSALHERFRALARRDGRKRLSPAQAGGQECPPYTNAFELGSTGRPKAAFPCTSRRTRMSALHERFRALARRDGRKRLSPAQAGGQECPPYTNAFELGSTGRPKAAVPAQAGGQECPPYTNAFELGSTGRPKAAFPCTSRRTRMSALHERFRAWLDGTAESACPLHKPADKNVRPTQARLTRPTSRLWLRGSSRCQR